MKSLKEISESISIQTFLNSFLRDFENDSRVSIGDSGFKVNLNEGNLYGKFLKKSIIGSHRYNDVLYNDNVISLELLVSLIYSNFSKNSNESVNFISKVLNSSKNILENLKHSKFKKMNNYLDSEMCLLLGHPFHPYPKYKGNIDKNDSSLYSPEINGVFRLFWIEVTDEFFDSNISSQKYIECIKELVKFELGEEFYGRILIPMHPWQWKKLKAKRKYYKKVIEIGLGRNNFYSTSSFRSVYSDSSPLLMKYSMDVEITNSIRHLTKKESLRGELINNVLKNEVISKIDKLEVLYEPFYVAFKEDNGLPIESSIVQFREQFSDKVKLDQLFLLSSLCEFNPISGNCEIRKRIFEKFDNFEFGQLTWFEHFLSNIVTPILNLYLKYGVLLGAHMQNIIVELHNDLPNSVIYKDCQGTGFTVEGARQLLDNDYNNENILSEDDVNKVFGYYLIVNTVFGVISSISNSDQYIELKLLAKFRIYLIHLKNKYEGNNFINYLLDSDFIFQKGNLRCCLSQINESTAKNPWTIYNKIKNPLKALRPIKENTKGYVYEGITKKNKRITFRVIEKTDIDLFHEWHHKKYVSEFWELNLDKESLVNYIDKVIKSPYQLPLIVEVDGIEIGYFEVYWAFEDRLSPYCDTKMYDRGIHILFGEEKYLRTRIIYDCLLHLTDYLFKYDNRTSSIWGEPRSDNKNIMKFCKKLPGWKFIKEFDFPHKRAALLECSRDSFYKEYESAL